MKQRKTHIARLAFLMLVLFVSPITVKAMHHHLPRQISAIAGSQAISVYKAQDSCPVCQFEFVTYIAFIIPDYSHFRLPVSPDCSEPIHGTKGNSFTCYSLRAPPVY